MHVEDLARHLPALFCALFVAILFIQSGLDKVFDWKGNLEWLTGHFAKSFLKAIVPMMLATIMIMELATGVMAAAGLVYLILTGSPKVIFYASVIGAAS